jgi:Domain of unknown function (DUF4332)
VVAAPTRRPRRNQPMLIERTVIPSTTLAGSARRCAASGQIAYRERAWARSGVRKSPPLEYAELLEASRVDTVKELAQRNGAHLTAKMAEVNETKKLVRREAWLLIRASDEFRLVTF